MDNTLYLNTHDALLATDVFYDCSGGFGYSLEYVTSWIKGNVDLPETGRVLDLCCGDGIWSKGMQKIKPNLELYGVDISRGAINKAQYRLGLGDENFKVGDTDEESLWPFNNVEFDLIFARGPGLYNQHSMNRASTVNTISRWHSYLSPNGVFYSIFYSDPKLMGQYTSIKNAKLPYNRCPRKSENVIFEGGKYHHSQSSFLTPFLEAGVKIIAYKFVSNFHILVTTKWGLA